MNDILQVKNLAVSFSTYRGKVSAVRNVSFAVKQGQALGIVGESGCGKSVTAHAVMGLLPKENSRIERGSILFEGRDITHLDEKQARRLRGRDIAMIFQDPMTSLNPVMSIGAQLVEALRVHEDISAHQAKDRAVELMHLVGIPSPAERLNDYPHQFSGGMRQRVMIAMALSCRPKLLLADEPTTALDVTVQAQILALLRRLKDELNMALILISHDLGVIANICDDVAVMYAGQVVEQGSAAEIFYRPHHPYTKGLLASLPRLTDRRDKPLSVIEGQPPDLMQKLDFCPFAMRCNKAMNICARQMPQATVLNEQHQIKCWLEQAQQYKGGEA